MKHNWHSLRIVPIESLHPVALTTESAVREMAHYLTASGVQKDPISVMRADSGKLLILDGAARHNSLKRIGARDALIQLVDNGESFRLSSWRHIVNHLTVVELRKIADRIGLNVFTSDETLRSAESSVSPDRVHFEFPGGVSCDVVLDRSNLDEFNDILCRLVKAYIANSPMVRYPKGLSSRRVPSWTDNGQTYVTLPDFDQAEVLQLSEKGKLLPPHILNCSFPGRFLGVRFPLGILSENASGEEKTEFLDELLRMRMMRSRSVFYPQSVVILGD